MIYEIWDRTTRNVLGAFETEGEAVHALRQFMARTAAEDLESLSLISVDRFDVARAIASGRNEITALIERGGTVSAR